MLLCFFVKQKTAYEMRISDWSSDVCSSDLVAIIAADADFGVASEMIGWTFGNHVYRTGNRVATVERALRTAQNFDALDIAKRTERARSAAGVDVVDEHADRTFRAGVEGTRADAPNIQLRPSGRKDAEIEARHARPDVLQAQKSNITNTP